MKLQLLNESAEMTPEMIAHNKDRTTKHIDCVARNVLHLCEKNPDIAEELAKRAPLHDLSKWEEPEYTPYIWLTWRYKCVDDGAECKLPEGMDEEIQKATWHHIKTNSHHPEYWDDNAEFENNLNKKDRDKPPQKSIDATGMDTISLMEMVADWHAMSLERGGTTKEWADKNVNKRWTFSDDQVDIIYKAIEDLEDQTVFVED